MNYLTSTMQDYQPILVGAGCLALGYMYGRHCRAVMENQGDAPTTSDAACCAQITESFNYISDHAAVDSKNAAAERPSEADSDYSGRGVIEKREKYSKRDLAQLDVFDPEFFHKMPRKKEDMIWAQTAFKKLKSTPLRREVVRTKAELDQDSDDEVLAQRLEYFTKSASGTRQSVNKPRESGLLKPSNKKKSTPNHVTTSCEAKSAQDTTDSQKLVSKGAARSLSGLGALATPLNDDDDDDDQGESSLEDTCRSPKTLCLTCSAGDEQDSVLERGCQVELTNSALQTETITLPSAKPSTIVITTNCTVINDLLEENLENDIDVGLMDSADDHPVLLPHEADMNSPDATMEVDAHRDTPDAAMLRSRQGVTRVELPTSPPPELLHG
ncbi:hypothetical protein M758_1G088700 [Ceratodon purpureus]|nr:hypothetical protein M758_1G088700 [Ceratodon purpureus]